MEFPFVHDQPVASFGELIIVMRELVEASIFLHNKGIFYRDFKHSNLRWDGRHLIIIDFDCATFLTAPVVGNVGTDGYKAPG